MKVTRIIFTPTGARRYPAKGEFYAVDRRNTTGVQFAASHHKHPTGRPERILHRTEEEVEIEEPVPEWILEYMRTCSNRSDARELRDAWIAAKERGEA